MNKSWLLVIVLAIGTALFLTYLYIPPIKQWLTDSGVVSTVEGFKTSITDIASGKMPVSTVVPLLGTAATLSIGAIKKAFDWVKREKENTQIKLTDAQSTIGDVKAMASDMKDSLTGTNEQLLQEFNTFKTESETEITDLKDLVDVKDNKIIDVQDELAQVQKQLIGTQSELKEAVTQRDEYRIALKIKEVPTLN